MNYSTIAKLVEWCAKSEAIAEIREKARSAFFGYDDSRPVEYLTASVGATKACERRFLGWFVFACRYPRAKPVALYSRYPRAKPVALYSSSFA